MLRCVRYSGDVGYKPMTLADVARFVGAEADFDVRWRLVVEFLKGQIRPAACRGYALGEPDRDQLYAALSLAEERLGRPVQAAIRDSSWLETGSGAFHDTVTTRPMLRLALPLG
jgi:hypothetical protein